jgi:hypothetical protein
MVLFCIVEKAAYTHGDIVEKTTFNAGTIVIEIDANVKGTRIVRGNELLVTPLEWDVEKVINILFNDGVIDDILKNKERYDDEIKFDGRPYYMDVYSWNGAEVYIHYPVGRLYYISKSYDMWKQEFLIKSNYDDHSVRTTISNNTDDLIQKGKVIAKALGILHDLYPNDIYRTYETIDDREYVYDTVDFLIVRNDILCESRSYFTALSAEDRIISGESFSISFDKDGVCSVSCCIYNEESSEEMKSLIPYTSAIEALTDKYSMIISEDTVHVHAISLCYVLTPVYGSMLKYHYVPAWRFCTETNDWPHLSVRYGNNTYFNALDASEIL